MPLPRFAKLDPRKRDAILEAALDEFSEHGFENSSFNRILARVGVSKGAIYYYFVDKEDLYLTVLERAFAGLSKMRPAHATDSVASYWAMVRSMYSDVIALARRDVRVVRLLQRSTADVMRLTNAPRLEPLLTSLRTQTDALLRAGQSVGAIRDDLDLPLLSSLTFAVGAALDQHMMASGELRTESGANAALERGMDTLRRLLAPGKRARSRARR